MTLAVLQVGAFPFPLGQGSQVYVGGMCGALAAAGARVWLATYGGEGAWPAGVERVPMPRLDALQSPRSGPHAGKLLLDAALVMSVARVLRRDRIDVVHAHNVEAPFVAALARALCAARVPLVYNLHTSLEEELPAYWRRGLAGKVAGPLGRAVDHAIPRMADACVALSERAEVHLRAHGAERVVRIGPGVNVDELRGGDAARARARWGLDDRHWVLYTGNTDAYQDLDLLMEAMHHVPDAGLLMATSSLPEEVWAYVDAARLSRDRVRVAQVHGLPDLADALSVGAIAAVPRRLCAGFPIKLLNTLGAGVVTVAAAGSAQPIAGCVRADDTPQALGRALRACLAEPDQLLKLGREARAEVAAQWSWAARATELLQFYATLM